VGPECCFGALTSGDIEMLEHSYPIIIHRYSLMEDSGGAGRNRGGSGTCWEVEPLDTPMTLITFGEGRRIPAMGAAGAKSTMVEKKVGRLELTRNGETRIITNNVIETIQPGERAANKNPGGGGYGDPFERDVQRVVEDVRNGLVSLEGARLDYGVVITDRDSLTVDQAATARLRAA
jgi:N-methylhydantoinase B